MPSGEKNSRPGKIFFMVPAPVGISPGQRFRFEHYLEYLDQKGFKYRISSFYNREGWRTLYQKGKVVKKILTIIVGFLRRVLDMFRVLSYDYVYLYREGTPIGPPVFEWIMAKILRKKIIYDFDDAIWIPAVTENNKWLIKLKWFNKVSSICKWSHMVSVGNPFLAEYARRWNTHCTIIPTVVDTINVHNQVREMPGNPLTIGWTGTFSTLKYLDILLPVLQELEQRLNFTFLVIADKDPALPLRNYRFIPWSKQTEISDLLKMDIGLMPLTDDDLSRGKCGFKAIQYMALGIPAVVSPVGVNSVIVDNNVNGFVCNSREEWSQKLELLLTETALLQHMGRESRKKIEQFYSVTATKDAFIQLFQ